MKFREALTHLDKMDKEDERNGAFAPGPAEKASTVWATVMQNWDGSG
jgi:hypothetical protein